MGTQNNDRTVSHTLLSKVLNYKNKTTLNIKMDRNIFIGFLAIPFMALLLTGATHGSPTLKDRNEMEIVNQVRTYVGADIPSKADNQTVTDKLGCKKFDEKCYPFFAKCCSGLTCQNWDRCGFP